METREALIKRYKENLSPYFWVKPEDVIDAAIILAEKSGYSIDFFIDKMISGFVISLTLEEAIFSVQNAKPEPFQNPKHLGSVYRQ